MVGEEAWHTRSGAFHRVVGDQELFNLYGTAKIFVFPSLHEGFGFPPLEAMAFGVPVVCSNVPTLREVCGGHPIYFDPRNVHSIAKALLDGLSNDQWRLNAMLQGRRYAEGWGSLERKREWINQYLSCLDESW